MRKVIALLMVLGLALMLAYPVMALKVDKEEKILPYKKGDTIDVKVYIEVENENETGKYKLEVEKKEGFEWVDDDDVSETIDTVGEGRWLIVQLTSDDASDGKYIFTYHIYKVVNGTENEIETDTFEVEIGKGDNDACGLVFFAIPVVGLVALVALVRRE